METVLWVGAGIVGLVVLWWLFKVGVGYAVPPEVSGIALLKQELRQLGVDTRRIPDAALDEIVASCILTAKGMAAFGASPQDKNWRANLVSHLQVDAGIVKAVMAGERPHVTDETVREILTRYGVIK